MPNHVLKHFEPEKETGYFALHFDDEFFKLILLLNFHLGTRFVRTRKDLTFKSTKGSFMSYNFVNKKFDLDFWIYNNFCKNSVTSKESLSLFQESVETFFLMPEIPSVQYVLKCAGDQSLFANYLKKIPLIKEVISIYKIPKKKLKSKENLIFE
jgi:hypothetical protein